MDKICLETSLQLTELIETVPKILLEKHFDLQPCLKAKYGKKQIKHYLEDTGFHIRYLSESIRFNEPVLFNEYLSWLKIFFSHLPVTDEEIIENFELLRDELNCLLPENMTKIVSKYVNDGISHYKNYNPKTLSFITPDNPHFNLASSFLHFLIDSDKKNANNLIIGAVKSGVPVKDIYLDVFQITQREVGRLWQSNRISVAQEHYITASTQLIMSQLYPYLFTAINKDKRIIVACIEGELHEMGARIVADLFEMDNWDSYYIGANTPRNALLDSIKKLKPNVIALSVTMVYHLHDLAELIKEIKSNNEIKNTKIIVGGFPFLYSDDLWKNVGADGYGIDGNSAINMANLLIK